MTLQDKVIAKIKEYFPNVKVVTMADTADLVSYGISTEIKKEEKPEYEYVHKVCSSNNVNYRESGESAESDLINELNCIRFYKAPDILFIRATGTKSGFDFSCRDDHYLSVARFSLGYKL